MDRVLITGASGNVGREVVTACSRAGLRVRVADRASHRSMAESFERVSLDFTAPQTWDDALRGCDGLFLLRPPPISDMQRTLNPARDASPFWM